MTPTSPCATADEPRNRICRETGYEPPPPPPACYSALTAGPWLRVPILDETIRPVDTLNKVLASRLHVSREGWKRGRLLTRPTNGLFHECFFMFLLSWQELQVLVADNWSC